MPHTVDRGFMKEFGIFILDQTCFCISNRHVPSPGNHIGMSLKVEWNVFDAKRHTNVTLHELVEVGLGSLFNNTAGPVRPRPIAPIGCWLEGERMEKVFLDTGSRSIERDPVRGGPLD